MSQAATITTVRRTHVENIDRKTVAGFGDEWERFTYLDQPAEDLLPLFEQYFAVFPWDQVGKNAVGFDAGAGTGRWARLVAPRVGKLHCVDASDRALATAAKTLANETNVEIHHAPIESMPLADGSMDFGYSLGVLHHMPDTPAALAACVRKLKPGAPFLLYLYYAFDNRPFWFRRLWQGSEALRHVISHSPDGVRYALSQVLAATVYWPLAKTSNVLERIGVDVEAIPLSAYRTRSFYMMRNDALDRFGTRLEQRFTQAEMRQMMEDAGLERVRFHDGIPFWCAVGFRK